MADPLPPDAQQQPARYRPSVIRSAGMTGAIGVALVAGWPMLSRDFLYVGVAFLALCAYSALGAVLTRITLYPDRIEMTRWGRRRRMARDDIAGRQSTKGGGPTVLVLRSKRPGEFPMIVPLKFATDAHWEAWMKDIPDLDQPAAAR